MPTMIFTCRGPFRTRSLATAALGALLALGCARDTSRLAPELEQRLNAEGIVHRADNVTFRWTHSTERTDGAWRDRRESIIVTGQTVLIHDNDYLDLEITPRSRRALDVHREGNRVRINAGSGRSAVVWSFEPPDSAEAWTVAIRAVIRASQHPPAAPAAP